MEELMDAREKREKEMENKVTHKCMQILKTNKYISNIREENQPTHNSHKE